MHRQTTPDGITMPLDIAMKLWRTWASAIWIISAVIRWLPSPLPQSFHGLTDISSSRALVVNAYRSVSSELSHDGVLKVAGRNISIMQDPDSDGPKASLWRPSTRRELENCCRLRAVKMVSALCWLGRRFVPATSNLVMVTMAWRSALID